MLRKALWLGLALSVLAVVPASAGQGGPNKKTVLTFSQPVEISGHVLPAGTYTFSLADSLTDRNIVEIYNADGTRFIALVMAIPNYRLKPTDQTVVKFREVPTGSPEAVRAWFYPGDSFGQEFVYPKQRAALLAKASNAPVPALAVDVDTPEALKTAPIIAVTPEEQELPVTAVIQTTPLFAMTGGGRELPKTASALPLIVLLGLGSIGVAFGLLVFGKFSIRLAE
jgi:hypothetical protein